MDKKMMHQVAFILVLVGALNWGLVGLLNFNVVNLLLGNWPIVEKAVYVLVGVGALYIAATHKEDCKWCKQK